VDAIGTNQSIGVDGPRPTGAGIFELYFNL
jgi:hypothetical protein